MIKKLELHVIGDAPAREHYFIVSEVHRPVFGDVSGAPVEVKFSCWCRRNVDICSNTIPGSHASSQQPRRKTRSCPITSKRTARNR